MSVSKWRWTEACDAGPCPGDCDFCHREEDAMGVAFTRRDDYEQRYIVDMLFDQEERAVAMKSAHEIFELMDMSDCYDVDIDIWEITEFGERPEHRNFLGTWTHYHDPLRMEITDDDGNVLATGYGTDN